MKHCVQIISIMFAMLMLAACSNDVIKSEATTPDTNDVEISDSNINEENQFISDSLPHLDFNGDTVNIFCWESWDPSQFDVKDDTGDIIDTAVYYRNLAVEDRLNVKLNWVEFPRNSAAYGSDLKNAVMQQNQSGDNTYDIVACYGMRVASCAVDGLLMNLHDTTFIDLSQPWYNDSATQAGTLYTNHTYFCAGDISFNALARMSGIFFNRGMINSYNYEDPYDLVLDGTWTIEKMHSMVKDMYIDLDNDGKQSDKDQYGLMSAGDQIQTLYYGTGLHFISHDENNSPKISEDVYGDRVIILLDKYLSLFAEEASYKNPIGDDPKNFDEGRVLFYVYPLGHVSDPSLRESEIDYGFIPQPKIDELSDRYYASVTNAVTLFAIPFVVESEERASALMECLSSEGYRQVSPVIFEQAYKAKYNYDDSNRQAVIFDMLRENAVFDFGKLFADSFNGFSNGVIGDLIWNNRSNFASTVASHEGSWVKSLEKLIGNIDIG